MTMQPSEQPDRLPAPTGTTVVLPRMPRSALVLAFLLLVASGVMLGGLVRQHFIHPLLDSVWLVILSAAVSAAMPAWRHAVGQALVGVAAVLLAIVLGIVPPVRLILELLAAMVLLAGLGVLQLERYPAEPLAAPEDTYWRSVSLTRILLGLLARRT